MGKSRYLDHQPIDIARGIVLGTSSINKFGYHGADVSSSTVETVWDGNGTTEIYPYPVAGQLVIAGATNTDDDGELVEVQGLDTEYNLQTEQVPVGGAGAKTFLRVFRAFMVSTENSQDILISLNANLAAIIIEGVGQTQMAVYTVPAGKTGYLTKIHGSSDRSNGSPAVQFRLKTRELDSPFRIKGTYGTAGGNQFDYEYSVPLKFDEKTDIRVDVVSSAACKCGAIFDIILVDNP